MIKKLVISGLLAAFSMVVFGQNFSVGGKITDSNDGGIISGATVSLLYKKDTTIFKKLASNAEGMFRFGNVPADSMILTIESIGYKQYVSIFALSANKFVNAKMDKQGKELAGVVIVGRVAPVVNKVDTAQYSASQFKVNPDASTEDLIKKMPGIQVAKDGTVTAQGETVKKVTIDGKEFFGDDASAALKNLPSEVVDKIQVFDRLSEQAQLTGVDDGNSVKAINVVTKTGVKNGQFGRAFAGYGTNDRYQAGGNVSFFKGDRRVSLVANFNNINQQNFGSQDLLGVTSSGGRGGGRGGMMGGMMGGMGGGNNFMVGQSNGISRTNAFGVNYSHKWGKKMNVSGSYFFNNSKNVNLSNISTKYLDTLLTGTTFATDYYNSTTYNTNHRINMRMEYKIDSNNSIFFIPSVSFQTNKADALGNNSNLYIANYPLDSLLSNTANNRNSDGFNIRNNLMYRRSFAKKGRTLAIGFNTVFTRNNSENTNRGLYRSFNGGIFTDSIPNLFSDNVTTGNTYGFNLAYTEPVGKNAILQFEYNPSIQKNKADQETYRYDGSKYNLFDQSLSNKFDNTNTTHNGGISYRWNPNKDDMLMVGLNAQGTKLESERIFPTISSVNQSFFNFLPRVMYRKKLSTYGNLRMFYGGRTDFPSVSQLQDVLSPSSSSMRVSIGNPNLKQSYSNFLMGRYSYANSKTSRSFFLMVFGQTSANYIANGIYLLRADTTINGTIVKTGSQLVKPINLDGYKSARTMATYTFPIKKIKSNLSLNTGLNYSLLPGFSNNRELKTINTTFNAGLGLASNISEYVDYNLSYNANISNAKTQTSTTSSTTKYINHVSNLTVNLLSKKGWFIQNDITNQIYTGLSAGFNQNYWLWNAGIGKKFMKNKAAELKLSVYDLLKQNQSIVRTVNASYIEDAQYNVLQRYFMLTFTYNLKNFGKAKPQNQRQDDGPRGPMMGGPGMMHGM